MNFQMVRSWGVTPIWAVSLLSLILAGVAYGQDQDRGGAAVSQPGGQQMAPIDLTGYWVSIVNSDWRWRMVTPARGDYASVPINAEGKRVADLWDPGKDELAGEQCKSYGAPAIMRVPGRLHITWQDPNTLKVETDAGEQVRWLRFGMGSISKSATATWQGDSSALWEIARGAGGMSKGNDAPKYGDLKVITTHVRPGYLRKNGIPYSANAVMTEYWDLSKESNGDQWIEITTLINDPTYLQEQWVTSLHFKKEPDGSKWDPSPCSARW